MLMGSLQIHDGYKNAVNNNVMTPFHIMQIFPQCPSINPEAARQLGLVCGFPLRISGIVETPVGN